MQVESIKTHRVQYGESLEAILDAYLNDLVEGTVIAITSKVISVLEGRCVAKQGIDKEQLIRQEADLLLQTDAHPYQLCLTIKDGLLIPSAGVDESNVEGVYALYPTDVWQVTERVWRYLREQHRLEQLGVIITDSHTTVMRRGVTGIALAWCGFAPLYSYVGKLDLYAQPLKITQINLLDALAVPAVLVMGEGGEQTPLAVIREAPKLTFLNRPPCPEEIDSVLIKPEEDLYGPLLQGAQWEPGL